MKEKSKRPSAKSKKGPARASTKSTVSGSRRGTDAARKDDPAARKAAAVNDMVAAMPFNKHKAAEHGDASRKPPQGQQVDPPSPSVTGSTLSEANPSAKTGKGKPRPGQNPTSDPLDRVRVDDGGQGLTTNLGVPVADN